MIWGSFEGLSSSYVLTWIWASLCQCQLKQQERTGHLFSISTSGYQELISWTSQCTCFWSWQIYSVPWDINLIGYHFRLCLQKGHCRKRYREILKYENCQLIWAFHLTEVLFLGPISLCYAKGHCKTWWRNNFF